MKVVGIKMKRWEGKITHSQYVRVNLVDFEHPFFGRVWHGVHILDLSSSLLNEAAKQKIRENGGRWPESWLEKPDRIRRKLDFQSLVSVFPCVVLNAILLVPLTRHLNLEIRHTHHV